MRQTVVCTDSVMATRAKLKHNTAKINVNYYRATFLSWKGNTRDKFASSMLTFEAEPTRTTLQCYVAHFGFTCLTTFRSVLPYNHRISQDLSTVLTASRERKDQRKSVQYKKGWELVRRNGKWWKLMETAGNKKKYIYIKSCVTRKTSSRCE